MANTDVDVRCTHHYTTGLTPRNDYSDCKYPAKYFDQQQPQITTQEVQVHTQAVDISPAMDQYVRPFYDVIGAVTAVFVFVLAMWIVVWPIIKRRII